MRRLLLLVVCALCLGADERSSTLAPVTRHGTVVTNRIAVNKLSANRLALNKLSANKLSANRLARNDLLVDATSAEVMEYVVSCALSPDQTLTVDVEGTPYVFTGELGLAPRWTRRPLSKKEKRWVSACLIARVNLFEIAVPISLRGPHKALVVTPEEAAQFPVEEGAFYGDIFKPIDEPIEWVACRGSGQAAGEVGQLDDRDCAEPDLANPGFTKCGFTDAGDCADFAPPVNPYACKQFKKGNYRQCHQQAGDGKWKGVKKHTEVMTVFLTP